VIGYSARLNSVFDHQRIPTKDPLSPNLKKSIIRRSQ
jgi:hypothetical protein